MDEGDVGVGGKMGDNEEIGGSLIGGEIFLGFFGVGGGWGLGEGRGFGVGVEQGGFWTDVEWLGL